MVQRYAARTLEHAAQHKALRVLGLVLGGRRCITNGQDGNRDQVEEQALLLDNQALTRTSAQSHFPRISNQCCVAPDPTACPVRAPGHPLLGRYRRRGRLLGLGTAVHHVGGPALGRTGRLLADGSALAALRLPRTMLLGTDPRIGITPAKSKCGAGGTRGTCASECLTPTSCRPNAPP